MTTANIFFENKALLQDGGAGFFNTAGVWLVKVNGTTVSSTASLTDIFAILESDHGIVYASSHLWNIGLVDVELYIEYTGPYTIGIPTLSGPPIFISQRETGATAPIAKAVTLLIGWGYKVDLTTYPPSMKLFEHDRISPKRYNDPNPAVIMEGNRYILNVNGVEYKDNRDNTVTYWTGEETRGSLEDIFDQNPDLNNLLRLNYTYNDFNLSSYTSIENISSESLEIKYYVDEVVSTRVIKAAGDINDCVYNRAIYFIGKTKDTWNLPVYPKISENGFQCSLSPATSRPVIGVVSPDLIGFTVTVVESVMEDETEWAINLSVVDAAAVITQGRYRLNGNAWTELPWDGMTPTLNGSPVEAYRRTIHTPDGLVPGDILEVELTSSLGVIVTAQYEIPEIT